MLGILGQLYKMYVVLLNIYWCLLASVLTTEQWLSLSSTESKLIS